MNTNSSTLPDANPESASNSDDVLSPNGSELLSPPSKSRYGRTRKPKISEDFYNIDVILEVTRESRRSPSVRSPSVKSTDSPKMRSSSPMKSRIRAKDFVHVTGDTFLEETPLEPEVKEEVVAEAKVEEMIKEEIETLKQVDGIFNGVTDAKDIMPLLEEPIQADVSKVLKIISSSTSDPLLTPEPKSKSVLKTYSNKRKSYQKPGVVESFALPDIPIFPIDEPSEPKRIKSLDVPTPNESDINIVDKKLLDTPWKIASLNMESSDVLIEQTSADSGNKSESETSNAIVDENMNDDQTVHRILKEVTVKLDSTSVIEHENRMRKINASKEEDKKNAESSPKVETKKLVPVKKENLKTKKQPPRKHDNMERKNEAVDKNLDSKSLRKGRSSLNTEEAKTPSLDKLDKKDSDPVSPKKARSASKSKQEDLKSPKSSNANSSPISNNSRKRLRDSTPQEDDDPGSLDNMNLLERLRTKIRSELTHGKGDFPVKKHLTGQRSKGEANGKKSLNKENVSCQKNKLQEEYPSRASPTKTKEEKVKVTAAEEKKDKVQAEDRSITANKEENVEKPSSGKEDQDKMALPNKGVKVRMTRDVSKEKTKDKTTIINTEEKTNNKTVKEDAQDADEGETFENKSLGKMKDKITTLNKEEKKKIKHQIVINHRMSRRSRKQESPKDVPADVNNKEKMPDKITVEKEGELINILAKKKIGRPKKLDNQPFKKAATKNVNKKGKMNESAVPKEVTKTHRKMKQRRPRKSKTYTNPDLLAISNILKSGLLDKIELGDLMWAKIRGYPYWPCLISKDPTTRKFKDIKARIMYHVRFFGDNGRRSWIRIKSLLPFERDFNLDSSHETLKVKNNVQQLLQSVRPYLVNRWKKAVEEAQALVKSNAEERFAFFDQMFPKKPKLQGEITEKDEEKLKLKPKRERKGSIELELKEIEEEQLAKRSKSRTSGRVSDRPKSRISERIVNLGTRSKSRMGEKIRDSLEVRPKSRLSERISNLEKRKTRLSELENSSKFSPKVPETPKHSQLKQTNQISIDEPPDPFLKQPWQSLRKHQNTPVNEMNSEYSLSDTDSVSKSSSNTPISTAHKDMIARQKKNYLFKGVPRERVCQVCHKPGEIFKCKGPCSGLYHSKCSERPILKHEDHNVCVLDKTEHKVEEEKNGIKQDDIEENKEEINLTQESHFETTYKEEDKKECMPIESVVEIVHVDCDDSDFEHSLTPKVRLTPNKDFSKLPLSEQIDLKMKEVMQQFENNTRYADSTTDYTSSEDSSSNLIVNELPKSSQKKKFLKIKHVTADCITFENTSSEELASDQDGQKVSSTDENKEEIGKKKEPEEKLKDFKCGYCIAEVETPCHVCEKEVSIKGDNFRQKCSLHMCGKFYHQDCLKLWPQTQWSLASLSSRQKKPTKMQLDTFVCPLHVCHTCASDNPHIANSRCTSDKVVRCLRCPATYHTTNYCVPAGTIILSTSQIICPRHFGQLQNGKRDKYARTINTPWCFICSKGGDLICCETCPTSVHPDCMQINLLEDGTFICEDCESGRFPLYDEIVWVKLGAYRWWPALILFPNEVPDNVKNIPHKGGEFVVKFFGTHDHYWVHRGRVFLFQEGDKGHCSPCKKKVDTLFKKSIDEAAAAHQLKKDFKSNKEAEIKTGMKPPPYIRVKVNRPVGNVRLFDGNVSNTTSCECDPNQKNPCGPDSVCLNRLLLTECDPNICPAGDKCKNQQFEKRQYPPLEPFKTPARGWGLRNLALIRKGDFVIEYVGEIIDEKEYQRRIRKMHEQKDENYYFLTIDKDRIIDAGPKGNLARFMNHCCQPNCETQKWTVNGDTRVGLFAVENIPANSELTFNYNLECIGKEKKICKCGAPNCSGFIGVKAKVDESQKKPKKNNIIKKKKTLTPQVSKTEGPCFICGKEGDVNSCHNKICTKFYHLACVNLETWPEGKWVCPWHNCNSCSKRTIRCCVKCVNSYCPVHSEGNVRYDKLLGFICSEHDPIKELQEPPKLPPKSPRTSSVSITKETDVTSTTPDEDSSNEAKVPELLSVTSTPIKKKELVDFAHALEEIEKSSAPTEMRFSRARSKPNRSKRKREEVKNVKLTRQSQIRPPELPEVKLTSTVPARHLRTTRNSNMRTGSLLNRSNGDKDLPMRKRTKPRCEAPTETT